MEKAPTAPDKTPFIALGLTAMGDTAFLPAFLNIYKEKYEFRSILVMENSNNRELKPSAWCKIIRKQGLQSVAYCWNTICAHLFRQGYNAVLLTDSWSFINKSPEELESFIAENKADLYIGPNGWKSVIITRQLFLTVGAFDNKLITPFFAVRDYVMRMNLMGKTCITDADILHPDMKRDIPLATFAGFSQEELGHSHNHYVDKWGDVPMYETFKTPFNKK